MMPDEYEEWFTGQKVAKGLCSVRGCNYPIHDEGARFCALHHQIMMQPADPVELLSCGVGPLPEDEYHQPEEEVNERARKIFQGTPAGELLRHVADLVDGPRNVVHGDKVASFKAIAKAWKRLFGHAFRASDVALAMIALKEQRLRHGSQDPKDQRQHVEDILGYWAIYMELREAGE